MSKDAGRSLTIEERNKFLASALGAQSKRNCRKTVDGIEPKENIIVL
jgi:hypothetical protein